MPARLAETPAPVCATHTDLYQHPLLEEPPTSHSGSDRRQYLVLTRQAEVLCAGCPLLSSCLYDAVVRHDVSGYVAGTTAKQRQLIRRELRISVQPEDFDTLAGVTGGHRHVDHHEVVRLRSANPHESLERLAQRLGCSLSTVKRHLRRARQGQASPGPATKSAPSERQVLVTAAEVRAGTTGRGAAAA